MIELRERNVLSMDSLGKDRVTARQDALNMLKQESRARGSKFERHRWNSVQQTNKVDGGPFALMFAAYASHDEPIDFTQEDMTRMRRRIAWSIVNQKL